MIIQAEWLEAKASCAVMALLTDAGHQAYFVGGCVRNALLGAPVSDLDIATDARPQRVLDLAEQAGFRAVPTGIDHGTVTVIIDAQPFEITTFRQDIETDGRRAVVAFSDTVEDDARRRDFTMNALYAGPDGAVLDPVGGLPDLRARRVRFIDEPEMRIWEDALRILRFFRFHAWYGDPDEGIDPEGLAACAELADLTETLSRERVGAEMLKLLAAPDPAPAVASMAASGVLMRILPGADAGALAVLVHLENGAKPNDLRRLACLIDGDVSQDLRLSKAQARQLRILQAVARDCPGAGEVGYRHGLDTATDILLIRAALMGEPVAEADLEAVKIGADAVFPIRAKDLVHKYQGPALGAKLRDMESVWVSYGFRMGRHELLAMI